MNLQLYPRLKQFEAIVHHGTEFPMWREHCSMNWGALFNYLLIDQMLTVSFAMVGHDKSFTITSPSGVSSIQQLFLLIIIYIMTNFVGTNICLAKHFYLLRTHTFALSMNSQ